MAIDSTLMAAKIPAATYAIGDRVPLAVIRGPAIVRDGYGAAKLKRIFTGATTSTVPFIIKVKNSNWVDEMSNLAAGASDNTVLGNESGAIQSGQDINLTPNSGWQVYAEAIGAGTEAADGDVFCLIDVDYPSVAAVENPKKSVGFPVTIDEFYAIAGTAKGTLATAPIWSTFNVDVLKAGSKYLLTEAAISASGSATYAFVSVSGAAGQAGLERIIPCRSPLSGGLRYSLDYSTPLVKGPMNLNFLIIGSPVTAYTYLDFVKKGI